MFRPIMLSEHVFAQLVTLPTSQIGSSFQRCATNDRFRARSVLRGSQELASVLTQFAESVGNWLRTVGANCSTGPMAPRPRWWHQLQASKKEALLAIDLYNRSGKERQLEAFIVHMSLAWLRLMQAYVEKNDGDPYIRDKNGKRQRIKGTREWRMKALDTLTEELLPHGDPRRDSLAFFTGLRHQIEHRYEKDFVSLVAGCTQAYVLNYENAVVDWFGENEGVGDELRFPIFVSSFSDDAVSAVKRVRKRVPKGVVEWVEDFDASRDSNVVDSPVYDFRLYLIPQTGPKTEADASMTFVKTDDLDSEQLDLLDKVQTIIRDKQVPVGELNRHKPTEVAALVEEQLGKPFKVPHHTKCRRHYDVRTTKGGDGP